MNDLKKHSTDELEQIVKDADIGGREPAGKVGLLLAIVAAMWSLFQL